jgi:hypothetical protein
MNLKYIPDMKLHECGPEQLEFNMVVVPVITENVIRRLSET